MRNRWGIAVLSSAGCLILASGLTACSLQPSTPPDALAGTAWRLHAIQSMDDAQGRTLLPASRTYTLLFGADHRASLQLDCNRGAGRWKAAGTTADSGTLVFGPIAATRALCAAPDLDERIVRDLAHVRSYRIIDGRLYLSLMADGGIYEWRPDRE